MTAHPVVRTIVRLPHGWPWHPTPPLWTACEESAHGNRSRRRPPRPGQTNTPTSSGRSADDSVRESTFVAVALDPDDVSRAVRRRVTIYDVHAIDPQLRIHS